MNMSENSEMKIVILAARSTIGRAVTNRLTKEGSQVALIGRDLSTLNTTTTSFCAECDLTDFPAVQNCIGEAKDALGGVTGVLNCSGSMVLKPAHLTDRETFDETIEANLATAFATVRASAKHLSATGGSVVLMSSAAATLGMPNHELIGAAKSGIEGLVRSAAATYAPRSLRFNAVAPGLVETNISQRLTANKTSLRISEALHPLGRIGNADEVASAICWLLNPEQSWVTGQVIAVDGGLGRVQPRPRIGSAK